MATYTGVADGNGDFIIPFSSNYTGGQKITVTAEKDGATKSIELHAPSDVTGGGVIQFSGTLIDFPLNIGVVTISGISGKIGNYAFQSAVNGLSIWKTASGLVIGSGVTEIGDFAFENWANIKSLGLPAGLIKIGANAFFGNALLESLVIPNTVTQIGAFSFYASQALTLSIPGSISIIPNSAFAYWVKATDLVLPAGVARVGSSAFANWSKGKYLTLPESLAIIESGAFSGWVECLEIRCLRTTPPTLESSAFQSLKSTCIIKVPSASLAAYQAATNWSAHASKMIGV